MKRKRSIVFSRCRCPYDSPGTAVCIHLRIARGALEAAAAVLDRLDHPTPLPSAALLRSQGRGASSPSAPGKTGR